MITWNSFLYWAIPTFVLSVVGSVLSLRSDKRSYAAVFASLTAVCVLSGFVAGLWTSLERPPLRTMGETRLWYSLFMLIAGLFTYLRWGFRWILSFSTLVSTVFLVINILRPDIHDRSLMPALQSPWFIPHVTVYIFSYSVLGCAFLLGLYNLRYKKKDLLPVADNLVHTGLCFLTLGMLFGSLWAKEAWGRYWSWDPKETWAVITWVGYLLYIHLRLMWPKRRIWACVLLILSFVGLQICWYGVNYLPSAQNSVHAYTRGS